MSAISPIISTDLALVPLKGGGNRQIIDLRRPVSLLKPPSTAAKTTRAAKALVFLLNCDKYVFVRDLLGTAGLLVNGRAIEDSVLQDGDELELGGVAYRVQAPGVGPHASRPDPLLAHLVHLATGAQHRLCYPVTTIGTGTSSDIALSEVLEGGPGEIVALMVQMAGRLWFWDLQPSASSSVDGKAVTRTAVNEGSVVTVRGDDFQLVLDLESQNRDAEVPQREESPPREDGPGHQHELAAHVSAASDQEPTHLNISKEWGPLAFAVATLDQPEANPGDVAAGRRIGASAKQVWMWITLLAVAGVIIGLGALCTVAWVIWKRHFS